MRCLFALLIVSGLAIAGAETTPWTPWLNLAGIPLCGLGLLGARKMGR